MVELGADGVVDVDGERKMLHRLLSDLPQVSSSMLCKVQQIRGFKGNLQNFFKINKAR